MDILKKDFHIYVNSKIMSKFIQIYLKKLVFPYKNPSEFEFNFIQNSYKTAR